MGIPWDGTGINCYGMGMGQINMSLGQPCKLYQRSKLGDRSKTQHSTL